MADLPANGERAVAPPGHPPELTIDRLFDAPALAGPSITGLRIAPDESCITFLKGKDSDKDRLDLWALDLTTGTTRLLVDSSLLHAADKPLADEEIGRRERQRTAALKGIVEYAFSSSGDALLFPAGGDLFHCRIRTPTGDPAVEAVHVAGPVTDPSIAPKGTMLAYVREQDLFVFDLARQREQRLTLDGGGVIKNGMAEFVAQEEMDRSTGYWWSPDGTCLAFIRIDESRVPETQRFEIAADNVTTFPQRYPLAGAANVRVTVGIVTVDGNQTVWVDLGPDDDIYVARVNWLPDGKSLAIQRQSRDQQRLDLLFADTATGCSRVVLTETSDSWIDLHHELTFLKNTPEFVWASSRSGFMHLYLHAMDGSLIRPLTQGKWNVDNLRARAIAGVEEHARTVFFMATAASPLERHLYKVHLDSTEMAQVTRDAGMHAVSMSPSTNFYLDHFNSTVQPPRVGLYERCGALRLWLLENRLDARHPSAPYLSTSARIEFGQLTADDGQTLFYRVSKPHNFNSEKRYPAILDVYGGPGVQRVQNLWTGSAFSQILTRAGYVVLTLDNRGTAHRGIAFQSPIHGRLGDKEIADQRTGARWLAAQAYIDADNIGVWGWSYGGYMALMLIFRCPDLFKAGISGAPVTDWCLYDTHYTERYLGTPAKNAGGYESSSVLTYAKGLAGSLLIIHGMADDNVLLLHSTKLFRRLQDLGKPFQSMLYPGAKHGLLRQHDGRHAYATMLRFFDDTLKH